MGYKILVVDDDIEILDTLRQVLANEKFNVLTTDRGREGLELAREKEPDLILLDLVLPDLDGLEICNLLKNDNLTNHIPIIMISRVKIQTQDRILGLETGADDYVTKPFSTKEVVARIKAVLRRVLYKGQPEEIIEKGGICINLTRHTVEVYPAGKSGARVKKKIIELAPKEFDLLFTFLRKEGRVLTPSYLLESVWGYESDTTTKTLDVHISRLRKKLGPEAGKKIETVEGVGYKFNE